MNNMKTACIALESSQKKHEKGKMMMKKWFFNNGIEVYEKEFDYDPHCFDVFHNDKFLGSIYPNSIKDMEMCIQELDNGHDPITYNWEDGCGNPCTFDGWGNDCE